MKNLSMKFFFTSVVCLLLMFFYVWRNTYMTGENSVYLVTMSTIFGIAFLVFFILGWVWKDKPAKKENLPEVTNDKQ